MDSAKVSIIVPVYNASAFLKECIDSVLSQSYTCWELLLIDDGSTDSSADICIPYTLKDERIKFFHKTNTGVSDTRNYGLNVATGKYIIFLDSDDYWFDEQILLQLVNFAEKENLDIVRAEYKEVTTDGNDLRFPDVNDKIYYKGKVISSLTFLEKIVVGEFFLVLSLIKKDCIGDLRFNTNRIFLEDAEFYLSLLQSPLKCAYLPIAFYAYRKHSDSVTVKIVPGNKKLRDAFDFTRLCFNLSKKTNDNGMKEYLVTKGVDNYIFDILVIGESKKTYKDRDYWFSQWDISTLEVAVKQIIKENHLSTHYKTMYLPLELRLKYYRYKYHIRLFLSKIKHIIFK